MLCAALPFFARGCPVYTGTHAWTHKRTCARSMPHSVTVIYDRFTPKMMSNGSCMIRFNRKSRVRWQQQSEGLACNTGEHIQRGAALGVLLCSVACLSPDPASVQGHHREPITPQVICQNCRLCKIMPQPYRDMSCVLGAGGWTQSKSAMHRVQRYIEFQMVVVLSRGHYMIEGPQATGLL